MFFFREFHSEIVLIQSSLEFQASCLTPQGPWREKKEDMLVIHVKKGIIEPKGKHQINFLLES